MSSREEIHSRMLREVARIWGYQESEMDLAAFDPVVSLLLGACSTEFEKLYQETSASRERILERLASTLTPEVLTTPTPAHAILHARAVETETLILPSHQFYYKKKVGKEEREIYFSTPGAYRMVKGRVRYLAAAGNVFDLEDMPRRELVLQSEAYKRNHTRPTLWLGLELDSGLDTLTGLSFFFNWKNETRLRALLRQLPFCSWFAGQHELVSASGIPEQFQPGQRATQSVFEQEFSPLQRIKRRVEAFYKDHFITIAGTKSGQTLSLDGLKRKFPEEFEREGLFPLEDLTHFEEKMLWLRVEFPEYFPSDALANIECQINCVPVLNKRFHKETYRTQDQINILPIRCDDYFFDMHRVYNDQEQEFHAHPLANLRELESGTYTLRSRGAGKLDERRASHHLYHLIDLLRDESAAFAAFNFDNLELKIRKLNQEISDLEQHIRDGDRQREELPFVVVKSPKSARNNQISLEFWSTNGEEANGIATGAKLDMYANRGFERDGIQLILGVTGGSPRKSASNAFYDFKKALTTRERIISKEDIRTFCFARLGERLQQVHIQPGTLVSDLPGEGIVRTLNVLLQPVKFQQPQDAQEWDALCYELEIELNASSSGLLPIQVLTQETANP